MPPEDTITLAGTFSAGSLADRLISTCPAGAGAVSVTWATPPWPPVTELTFTVSDASAADVLHRKRRAQRHVVIAAIIRAPLSSEALHADAEVALVCPMGTATRGDMPTAGCVLLSVTSASPVAGTVTAESRAESDVPVRTRRRFTVLGSASTT